MRKPWLAVWLAAALAFVPAGGGIAEVSPSSIAYLQAQPPNPWITLALVASGVANPPSDHLKTVSGSSANDYATTILALAALGQNPATFGSIDYVARLQSFATAGQLGDPNYLNDDAWGILALSAAGIATATPEVTAAAAFLGSRQNSDGGFPFAVGGASDSNSTAAAVMALRESGLPAGDAALQAAVGYLKDVQNSDGGFPYQPGGESDADSTAWVAWAIRKLGQDPASWQPTGAVSSPLEFLLSLANPDGSFAWMRSQPGPNAFATQDAALALSGATIPVGYFRPAATPPHEFRLEGRDRTLCDARLDGATAYDLLTAGATACGYTFAGSTYEGLGFLLTEVNGERASGFAAWQYHVNNVAANVGLQSYQLQPHDQVLVYWDEDYRTPAYPDHDRPLKLELSLAAVGSGSGVTATVSAYRDGQWQPQANATISGTVPPAVTAADGRITLTLPDGRHALQASLANFIRGRAVTLTVGDGVAGSVGLMAEVVDGSGGGGGGTVGGSAIIFTVNPTRVNFGRLQPGQVSSADVALHNGGTVDLAITAQATGDPLFGSLTLDRQPVSAFQARVNRQQSATTTAALPVPADYLGRGVKTGQLIFWAEAE